MRDAARSGRYNRAPKLDPEHRVSAEALFCRVGNVRLALPLPHVAEILRPLRLEPLARAPAFVRGVSIIRGQAVPVIDTAALLGVASDGSPRRLVRLRLGSRAVALTLDEVFGVHALDDARQDVLPPLLRDAVGEAVSAIAALDGELLWVLQHALSLPQDLWPAMAAERAA